MKALLIRTDKTKFIIRIGKKEIRFDDGFSRDREILEDILKLNGKEFEIYKAFIQENTSVKSSLINLISHYLNGYDLKTLGKFFTEEIRDDLLNSNLITEQEKISLRHWQEVSKKKLWLEINSQSSTFVYLMKDERTGCYKIGKSNNPQFRERTLQSDNPQIVLIEKWIGNSADEKILHKFFASLRIRGEWFELSETDIEKIYKYFELKDE